MPFSNRNRFSNLADSKGSRRRYPSPSPSQRRAGSGNISTGRRLSVFIGCINIRKFSILRALDKNPSIFQLSMHPFREAGSQKEYKTRKRPCSGPARQYSTLSSRFSPFDFRHFALYRRAGNFSGYNKTGGKRIREGGNCKRRLNSGVCQISRRTNLIYRSTR